MSNTSLIIKSLRVKKQMTQSDVAKVLNMPITTYIRKENGKANFTIWEALDLSNLLQEPVEKIFLPSSCQMDNQSN